MAWFSSAVSRGWSSGGIHVSDQLRTETSGQILGMQLLHTSYRELPQLGSRCNYKAARHKASTGENRIFGHAH